MPAYNRTGPEGRGPRTGRGLGDCKPEFDPEDEPKKQDEEFKEDIEYPRFRYGLGRGGFPRGMGRFPRGRGFRFID